MSKLPTLALFGLGLAGLGFAHAVMMCDGAGWHDERALTVPDNVTFGGL